MAASTQPFDELRDGVVASDHLLEERWPQRAHPVDNLRDAWVRGERLEIADERVPVHDEARYDAWTEAVIFRRSDDLVTCYSVREEHVTNEHGEAVREAVREQVWRSGGDE
ncbi:hypothetical protein Hbl1158_10345 [Halobaculum sp. CBA1158]|uniref:hypothetical protein n=1 Tax=Halobaculum sp. CBA1158 TaxID=2904243 RepID=UPI001F3C4303|nr:hypothetical protein [Halobaculum sp. CBA1158]UIO98934.1 hypothetical protein Hbl1158_10345 [Halobaculum sp. CBA1158]